MTSRKYVDRGATLSPNGYYRYLLWREWRGTHDPANWDWLGARDGAGIPIGSPKACVFVMFNPSTADGLKDDPTIRRCVSFAAAWAFERLEVVNLFAARATRPSDMLDLDLDVVVGPDNLRTVRACAESAGLIVCAWGALGAHLGQDETVLGWIGDRPIHVLGLTRDGHPRHPLYLKGDVKPMPWRKP